MPAYTWHFLRRFEMKSGPVILFLCGFIVLSENFYLLPALILSGHHEAEATMRAMATRARIMTIVGDLIWNSVMPRGIPLWAVQISLVIAGTAKACRALLAFGLLPSLRIPFTPAVAFITSLIAGIFIAPVHQIGIMDVLATGRSPARYRIMSWIAMEVAAMGVLLAPYIVASPPVVLFVTLIPVLLVMLRLESDIGHRLRTGTRNLMPVDVIGVAATGAKHESMANQVDQVISSTNSADREGTTTLPKGLHLCTWHGAFFLSLALLGTSGEALNDVATDLVVRDKLRQGDTWLGICYNSAVVVAMSGAFYVEVTGDETKIAKVTSAKLESETTDSESISSTITNTASSHSTLPSFYTNMFRESLEHSGDGADKNTKRTFLMEISRVRSMILSFATRISSHPKGRHIICILLWLSSQVFRSLLMPALRGAGTTASLSGERAGILLTSFVLIDKFVGPLGVAALDTALLWLISHGSSVAKKSIAGGTECGLILLPSTLLWALRSGSEKIERPFIQSVILSMSEGHSETMAAPGWMAPLLASMTAGLVVYVLRWSGILRLGSMASQPNYATAEAVTSKQ